MTTYKIRRFYQRPNKTAVTIKTGLTKEERDAHCKDPETSSRTCTLPENVAHTAEHGEWFDGWEEE